MPLVKLKFRPGINRDVTSYSNESGWVNGDKIRFRMGFPEKIGGWEKFSAQTYQGTARALKNWLALDGSDYLGIGTHLKYYIEEGGGFYDITPIRATTTNGITFAASDGSTTITATDSSHGASLGDFVTIAGAVSLGGTVTATVLNAEHQITSVPTANTFTFEVSSAANASDSGNGGSGGDAVYQISVGLDTQVGGTGWGAGVWGRGTWNSGADLTTVGALRLWSHDNFGEDLLINPRNGAIYFWDKSNGLTTRAIELSTAATNTANVPSLVTQVMVSDTDRHVIAFGCDAIGGGGVQDPLLIRFASQETLTDWTPTATNTAGDLRIGSGSEFIKAIQTKREIVIWTDSSLHSMRFIGPPFTFGITPIASNITIAGPNAAVAIEDIIVWMGKNCFYIYDGRVKQIPCTVKEEVFFNLNNAQLDKIYAGVNAEFGEVIWLYPSNTNSVANGGNGQNDKYVIYNYNEQLWYYGTINRDAWLDRGLREFPIATGSNYLYNHEKGYDDDGSALAASIESSQIDIGDGDRFAFISRLIPDLTFNGSAADNPSVNITIEGRNFPGGDYLQSDTSAVTRTAVSTSTVPFEQWTNKADIRVRGRSFNFLIASSDEGVRWRLGSPRVDARPDGRR
tara:strand:- start:405 stop:2282 length:1878 start_codon:yes stop_codon:yes gene_type:complete